MKKRKQSKKNIDSVLENTFAFILVILLVVVCFIIFPKSVKGENQFKTFEYTIKAGDTIWDIAEKNYTSKVDVRKVIYDIKKMNNIKNSGLIVPGEVIVMPIYE